MLQSPDIQLSFTPASYVFGKALKLEQEPGMTVAICAARPARSPRPTTRCW